jgi:hypothetical protein
MIPAGRPTKDTLLTLVPSFPIKTFLIDDGWQDVTGSRSLMSFHEWDGMKAPMEEVVESLKATGIEEVGVWLTLQGYWISIDKESALIKKYDCRAYTTASRDQPRGGINVPLHPSDKEQWLPSPEKAGQFWLDWFTQMKSWGIGFVKVRCPCCIMLVYRLLIARSTIRRTMTRSPVLGRLMFSKPCGAVC